MKGKKPAGLDREKAAEAELKKVELEIFKDFHTIMPETNRIAEISSQKWHEQTLALLRVLDETAKNRNLAIAELCRKERVTASHILTWVQHKNGQDTLYNRGAAQIIEKYNRKVLDSEAYRFFKKEIFLMDTKELMNALVTAIEANAFFKYFVPFIAERLDRIHLETPQFEERDRQETTAAKNLVKRMKAEGEEFSAKLEKSRNIIANQMSLHFLRERTVMNFGKKNLGKLIEKLEQNQELELQELQFIRKFRRVHETLARHELKVYLLQEKSQRILYIIQNTLVRRMLETPGARVAF